MVKRYEKFEEVAPGITVRYAENAAAYRSGKIWKSGGPKGAAAQDGAALLTGISFKTATSVERFLAELVERSGITEEVTGLELNLLCSKRSTRRTWGHYNPFKVLAGRRVSRIALYRWSVGTLVHEFAHHVDYIFQEGEGFKSNSGWHGPKFYEALKELHGIAFEILGTTEEAEYARFQERVNKEARKEAWAEDVRRGALERLGGSEARLAEILVAV